MTTLTQEHSSHVSNPCFVFIKFGDDQELLLNAVCSTQTFVDFIRKKCQCDTHSIVDLVDLEGQIRNLSVSSEDYASDFVTDRETYVAVRVEGHGESGLNRYIPLLNNLEKIHPELSVKLNNMSRPGTKNRRERLKKTQLRHARANSNKVDTKTRPASSERGSKSRQGK